MNASPPPAPGLSVVVVPFGGGALLERCLEAIERQTARSEIEILVVGDDRHDLDALRPSFPGIGFARLPGHRTWAEMRAAAVRRARAPIVAVTEAQCVPEPDWAAKILAAHRSAPPEAGAIGGVVDKGDGSVVGWALYYCDYARYAPPMPPGPAPALTDCNVSYRRGALEEIAERWDGELHEPIVHAALARRGRALLLAPEIVVRHQRAPGLGEAIADRFGFGRLFGATRAKTLSPGRRFLLAVAAPLVPVVVVGRAALHILRRRRHLGRLLVSLPAMVFLAAVWALGEATGTITGDPGALGADSSPGEGPG